MEPKAKAALVKAAADFIEARVLAGASIEEAYREVMEEFNRQLAEQLAENLAKKLFP